jgi:hypothetical protein
MSKQPQWVVTVKWRDPSGKNHVAVRLYPVYFRSSGKAIRPDQTRVIRDIVPQDCTTTGISMRRKR